MEIVLTKDDSLYHLDLNNLIDLLVFFESIDLQNQQIQVTILQVFNVFLLELVLLKFIIEFNFYFFLNKYIYQS